MRIGISMTCVAALLASVIATQAQAQTIAQSAGTSAIDWTTFRAMTSPETTISFSGEGTYVFAASPQPPEKSALYSFAGDWTTSIAIQDWPKPGYARATADGALMEAAAYTEPACCAEVSALGQTWREAMFTLSPLGSVTFQVNYAMGINGSVVPGHYTITTASILFENHSERADVRIDSFNGTSPVLEGTLSITYFNPGTSALTDRLIVGSVAISVAPVPEPETHALMLVGLALVGVALRRRQRAAEARRLA